MKNYTFLLAFFLFSAPLLSLENEEKIIQLHANKSLDQIAIEKVTDLYPEEELYEVLSSSEISNEELSIIKSNNSISQIDQFLKNDNFWTNITIDDLLFFLKNIDQLNSSILKKELIAILDINNPITKNSNENHNYEEFQKNIIDSLISLDEREKPYQIIRNLKNTENKKYNIYYKEFRINYLLSKFNLSEACDYRNEFKDEKLISPSNFFLKVDIFCLILEEKIDQANLLNLILEESSFEKDLYFQYLFDKLINNNIDNNYYKTELNKNNIYLYSAMHRIGNLPLTNEFLKIDSNNLSMPIILSHSTNIELRIKAAHKAYYNNLLSIESLAALYQAVDFSFDELNDADKFLPKIDKNIQIGMPYFYQLINIQLLPITRLEAILKFWDFAELNNLELIAYELSLKSLNSIEPSGELSSYGAKIAKAYAYSYDFEKANKWLLFFESSVNEINSINQLNETKILLNLFNYESTKDVAVILLDNLEFMIENFENENDSDSFFKYEILNLIFSIYNDDKEAVFPFDKKIFDTRVMPSIFVLNKIKKASNNNNYAELLLSIAVSINGKNWHEIHPEHLNLIFNSLKDYRDGKILNDILLEILKQTKII